MESMKRITLIVMILVLIAGGLPTRAQSDGEIQLRILNLASEAQSVSVVPATPSGELDQIDLTGPAPALSPYYTLPAETNALGVTIHRMSGFSGGGFTATFDAGHSYLLLVTQGEEGAERVLIDESEPFGDVDSPAMQGLARLMLIHAVPIAPAAYHLQNSDGNHVLAQILTPDLERAYREFPVPVSGFGVTAGDYTLAVSAADTGALIYDGIALSLAENQWTAVIFSGPSLESAQVFLLGNELTPVN